MAIYEIGVFCDCGDTHPMGVKVALNDGPTEEQTIGDTYNGKEVPQELIKLHNNSVQCPETGEWLYQEDVKQLFLVPVE